MLRCWRGVISSCLFYFSSVKIQSISLRERIGDLVEKHGSLREVSRQLRIDVGYLSRLQSGEDSNPKEAVVDKLKLVKVTSYIFLPNIEI